MKAIEKLFVVADTFAIADKGIVLSPGPLPGATVAFGDVVELRRPDGTAQQARVVGLASAAPSVVRKGTPMMLAGVGAQDVPPGTEVWTTGA